MKRFWTFALILCLIFSLAACGDNAAESNPEGSQAVVDGSSLETKEPDTSADEVGISENGKILVAYFSYSGNTQKIANLVAEKTGGDLVRIETVTPYSDNRDEVLDVAKNEQAENARPELSTKVDNMDEYDTIFIGYPNWWGTMPMAICSFLEEYDFAGKVIIPFCTHGGSALGRSEGDIAELVPDSTMLEGLAIRDSNVDNADSDVEEWLKNVGALE